MRETPLLDLNAAAFEHVTHVLPHQFSAAAFQSSPHVDWIDTISQFAKTGYLQVALIALSALWLVKGLVGGSKYHGRVYDAKTSQISLIYELASQLARGAALAFAVLAAADNKRHWVTAALTAHIFVLGLLRLANSTKWRHLLLHQVNALLVGAFFIVLASDFLPQAVVNTANESSRWTVGTAWSLAAAIFVAASTPRAWLPPVYELAPGLKAPDPKPSPEEICSWMGYYMTFSFMSPLVWKGSRKSVELNDFPSLPWYDEPLKLLSSVLKKREEAKQNTFRTVLSYQRTEITLMAIWIALAYSIEMVAPFALYNLLAYLADPQGAVINPVVWLCLMFLGPVARTVCFQQYVFTSTRVIVRVKSGLTQELYHRAISSMELEEDVINAIETRGGKDEVKSTSAGRLANLMSSDIDAIYEGRDVVIALAGVPMGIILAFIGLYKIVGWSAFVGIAFMVLMTPVPTYLTQIMGTAQRKVKKAQDSRISLISEYLSSIKAIKYFGWENAMVEHVQKARAKEQKDLWRITLLMTLNGELAELIPIFALALIFTTYAGFLKQPLTASVAFTTLSLIMTTRRNLAMLTWFTRNAVNAWISMDRLDRYFKSTTPLARYPVGPLAVKKATFRRNKKASFTLQDISLDFVEGGLNVISGPSGSGKTTLLLSILGETILESGAVTRPDDIAYASQTPWLQSETVRDNILFHSEFEQVRYDRVIKACALDIDLDELLKGDQTEVGENGTALSGGQKARVALARALYSKSPVLMLDDTFSALDAKTAAIVWKECFCTDLLKGRTTILVSQMPWVPAQADFSIVLENGLVKSAEQNIGIVRKAVVLEHGDVDGEAVSPPAANATTSQADTKPTAPRPKVDEIAQEMKASGSAGRFMFYKYMLWFGGPTYACFAIFTSVLSNVALIGTGFWLSRWVNSYDGSNAVDIPFYLGIYVAFTFGTIIIDGASFLTYANGSWIAAKKLHESCLRSVMGVSLDWWKDVPVGRVLNRLSRDVNTIDNSLAQMLQATLEAVITLLLRIGVVSSILPVFVVPGLISCVVGVTAGEMYTRTAVLVRRIVSSSQSPVFSQFTDSMAGLAVIRASGGMSRVFRLKLAERLRDFSRSQQADFNINRWVGVRVDLTTALVALCAGALAVSKAGTLSAGLVGFSLANATGLSESIMMLVRASNELEVKMQSFDRVTEYIELEPEEKTDDAHSAEIQAIEGFADHEERTIPEGWPRTGSVELRNVTVKYDTEGPEILKNINLRFEAGERVAVVGRTGSGKSTLILSLLRFTNVVSGKILYDGVDITAIPRKKLRQALTIIPQEATLFNGTVGSNLDPSNEISESRLQKAIDLCADIASFRSHGAEVTSGESTPKAGNGVVDLGGASKPTEVTPLLAANGTEVNNGAISVAKAAGGLTLNTTVNARGENFSHGQRQVLSLCRALVRRSKLMLLDEATSSMDYATDQGIQTILRADLSSVEDDNRTLVTIAHRLKTIIDYDKVVVLGAGRVIETGSPAELYAAKGQFYDMIQHSGESEELGALFGERH